MIPVQPQPEPADFDVCVRQPGNAWLRQQGLQQGKAPPHFVWKPYWRHCLDQLYEAYDRTCAFTSFYIHPVTGSRTTDHFVPKSQALEQAYEWSNYRLACSRINSRKSECQSILDPFLIESETFYLNCVTGHIYPNPDKPAHIQRAAHETIERLALNDDLCPRFRQEAFNSHLGGISLDYVRIHISPFVAYEIVRQGLVNSECDLTVD